MQMALLAATMTPPSSATLNPMNEFYSDTKMYEDGEDDDGTDISQEMQRKLHLGEPRLSNCFRSEPDTPHIHETPPKGGRRSHNHSRNRRNRCPHGPRTGLHEVAHHFHHHHHHMLRRPPPGPLNHQYGKQFPQAYFEEPWKHIHSPHRHYHPHSPFTCTQSEETPFPYHSIHPHGLSTFSPPPPPPHTGPGGPPGPEPFPQFHRRGIGHHHRP